MFTQGGCHWAATVIPPPNPPSCHPVFLSRFLFPICNTLLDWFAESSVQMFNLNLLFLQYLEKHNTDAEAEKAVGLFP